MKAHFIHLLLMFLIGVPVVLHEKFNPSAAVARADLITETPDQTGAALSETIYIELRQVGEVIDLRPCFNWE